MFQSTGDVTIYKIKISGNLPLFQGPRIVINYNKEMKTSDGEWNTKESHLPHQDPQNNTGKNVIMSFLRD